MLIYSLGEGLLTCKIAGIIWARSTQIVTRDRARPSPSKQFTNQECSSRSSRCAHCFVDANIFYYHLVETPPLSEECSNFFERVEKRHPCLDKSTSGLELLSLQSIFVARPDLLFNESSSRSQFGRRAMMRLRPPHLGCIEKPFACFINARRPPSSPSRRNCCGR